MQYLRIPHLTKALSTEERQMMSGTMGSLAKKLLPQKVVKKTEVVAVVNDNPAGPGWHDMVSVTGTPMKTLRNWWADFTADEGLPKDAPSKQPLAITNPTEARLYSIAIQLPDHWQSLYACTQLSDQSDVRGRSR